MLPEVLTLQAFVRGRREEAEEEIRQTLTQSGWVHGSSELAGGGVCLLFEVSLANVEWLGGALDGVVQFDSDSKQLLNQVAETARSQEDGGVGNIRGTLELSFPAP